MPTRLPADHRFALADVQERSVPVDGAVLSALHFQQPGAKGLIFFLHGNGGSLQEWFPSTDVYRHARFDVFMIDYRGYGKSTGTIESEDQLHADVRAAWNLVAPDYANRARVIYGRSLGTGLATKLATEVEANLLVLVSPYSSIRDAARDHYPWIPSSILRYPMPTHQWLPHVKMPTLILHGDRDAVIGVEHAVRLLRLARRGELIRIPEASHEDIHLSPRYLETLYGRLDAL
jgi:alpha-beta hydrolase superfamily lysophospholipase